MAVTPTLDRAAVTRTAVISGFLLVAVGAGAGLLVGLSLVQLLGWLGLHVDTGTGSLLRKAFLP